MFERLRDKMVASTRRQAVENLDRGGTIKVLRLCYPPIV
jgi:hypothetical protein